MTPNNPRSSFDGSSILILAPHPDDEIIGCGATIARAKDHDTRVYVHYLTVGNVEEWSHDRRSTIEQRVLELKQVVSYLEVDNFALSFPGDQYHLQLDRMRQADLIEAIDVGSEVALQEIKPDIVMIPPIDSYNQDHRAVARAALAALRPSDARLRHQPRAVLVYEALSDHWNATSAPDVDVFVALSERHVRCKLDAMSLYASQCREHPNPRSAVAIDALARVRGAQCGIEYAEAFRSLRWRI